MTDIDRDIAELETALRHLKKLRKAEQLRKAMTGKTQSAEVRARISAAQKKAKADPEVRARMSAAQKKAWADPEVRARISAAQKKAKAEKYEAEIAPKQSRELRKGLPTVPRDPYEALLFGGAAP